MKKLSPFEKATERYQNAQKMMFVKEQLKKELPPRGSAAYRYFSDPDKNPPSYYSLVESIDNMSLEECKNHPAWNWYSNVGWNVGWV
jgi:hypothetical protein